MSTQTFWLERTENVAVGLRRYRGGTGGFDCEHGYHSALVYTGIEPAVYREEGYLELRPKVPHDDSRWPTKCEKCSYEFVDDDHWQDWQEQIYVRADNGEQRVLHENAPARELGIPAAEPGAMWNAWWMPWAADQKDGRYLMCRLPDGHDWAIDSRASNCTMPDDNEHRCWVRSGDPVKGQVNVNKDGNTCAAGAGSIQSPKWHGFLRNGVLVE